MGRLVLERGVKGGGFAECLMNSYCYSQGNCLFPQSKAAPYGEC